MLVAMRINVTEDDVDDSLEFGMKVRHWVETLDGLQLGVVVELGQDEGGEVLTKNWQGRHRAHLSKE